MPAAIVDHDVADEITEPTDLEPDTRAFVVRVGQGRMAELAFGPAAAELGEHTT